MNLFQITIRTFKGLAVDHVYVSIINFICMQFHLHAISLHSVSMETFKPKYSRVSQYQIFFSKCRLPLALSRSQLSTYSFCLLFVNSLDFLLRECIDFQLHSSRFWIQRFPSLRTASTEAQSNQLLKPYIGEQINTLPKGLCISVTDEIGISLPINITLYAHPYAYSYQNIYREIRL